MSAAIASVRGQISAEALGRTLMHEHTYLNWSKEFPTDGLVIDRSTLEGELAAFAEVGGSTLVDLTPAEMTVGASPDPAGMLSGAPSDLEFLHFGSRTPSNARALRELSETTGINIIAGTGHYRDSFFDGAFFSGQTVESLADGFVRDITEGFPGTDGIRAGIIGEIGSDDWRVTDRERTTLLAAALAHKATGVAISLHAVAYPTGLEQVRILLDAGVDPARIIVGHADTVHEPGYHRAIVDSGAWVQFDTIRGASERDTERKLGYLMALLEAGSANRVLLSQDVGRRSLQRAAGHHGFTFLFGAFRELLFQRGVTPEVFDQLTIDNPRRALLGTERAEA